MAIYLGLISILELIENSLKANEKRRRHHKQLKIALLISVKIVAFVKILMLKMKLRESVNARFNAK